MFHQHFFLYQMQNTKKEYRFNIKEMYIISLERNSTTCVTKMKHI